MRYLEAYLRRDLLRSELSLLFIAVYLWTLDLFAWLARWLSVSFISF